MQNPITHKKDHPNKLERLKGEGREKTSLETARQRCGQDRKTARRQEGKREQEMLRFPLDVRCVSVPDRIALLPAQCVGATKEKEAS